LPVGGRGSWENTRHTRELNSLNSSTKNSEGEAAVAGTPVALADIAASNMTSQFVMEFLANLCVTACTLEGVPEGMEGPRWMVDP
jgi:predicted RND superfamily exporter protein